MRPALMLICLLASGSHALAETAKPAASGDFYAPQFSPDGSHLLVTGERMHGLKEIHLASGSVRSLSDAPRLGTSAHYRKDGLVAFKATRAGKLRDLVLNQEGNMEEIIEPEARTFAHSNRIYVRTKDGVKNISSGDRFFGPMLSPDGKKVAFTGLATGIHVYDLRTGAREIVGPGTAPRWSPDSLSLAYERTEDDGHDIVASDIWVWTERKGTQNFTKSDTLVERRPAWSPDGKHMAFDNDRGAIYIVTVAPEVSQ